MIMSETLGIKKGQLISIVGGGGKTSLMRRLSIELSEKGKKVLISTTTAIYAPGANWTGRIVLTKGCEHVKLNGMDGITALGSCIDRNGKLKGVPSGLLCKIKESKIFDLIIVEADGSKGRPVKAPAEHEPAIVCCSDIVVGVVGLDCIGKRISEDNVHRVSEFCSITGKREGEIIDSSDIEKLIMSPFGIFKNSGKAKRYVMLNKVETAEGMKAANQVIEAFEKTDTEYVSGIFALSLEKGRFIRKWRKT